MSSRGIPMLSDFGLAHLQESASTFESATDTFSGTLAYMATEFFCEDETIKFEHTTYSDVWAFGMIGQVSYRLYMFSVKLCSERQTLA